MDASIGMTPIRALSLATMALADVARRHQIGRRRACLSGRYYTRNEPGLRCLLSQNTA